MGRWETTFTSEWSDQPTKAKNPDQSLIEDSESGEMGNNFYFFRVKYMYVLTPVVVEGIQNGDHSIQTRPVAFVALKALQTTHPIWSLIWRESWRSASVVPSGKGYVHINAWDGSQACMWIINSCSVCFFFFFFFFFSSSFFSTVAGVEYPTYIS